MLIYGGSQADLFNPADETFVALGTDGSEFQNRSSHAAVLLADGTVLITGGYVGGESSARLTFITPIRRLSSIWLASCKSRGRTTK